MFEILMYLMEKYIHYSESSGSNDLLIHYDEIAQELFDSGIESDDILAALTWIKELNTHGTTNTPICTPDKNSLRIFSPEEQYKLDSSCLAFLARLETIGIVSPELREIIIDRAMALEGSRVPLSQLRWLIVLIFFYQFKNPEGEWFKRFMLAECPLDTLH